MATKNGIIKKTDLMSFSNIRSGGIIAVNLDKGDSLIATRLTDGTKSIFVGTQRRARDKVQRKPGPRNGTYHKRG